MFGWIRTKVRDAVLGGVVDAMEYLEGETIGLRQDAMGVLESRYKLLPAPIALNSTQDDSDMVEATQPPPVSRGRQKRS